MIFNSACWTPSSETSRVIDTFFAVLRNLVDLIDEDDPVFGCRDVVVGVLDQLQKNVLTSSPT
jgi:hypothetical protein